MSNTRWSVVVPEDTDRALRSYLARKGTKKGDLSRSLASLIPLPITEFFSSILIVSLSVPFL